MVAALLFALPVLRPELDLRLEASKPALAIGQPLDFTLHVTNRTQKPIRVVAVTPGFIDLRSPRSLLECRKAGSNQWIDVSQHPTCGNTDPINDLDFIEVKPGGTTDWQGHLYWNDGLTKFFAKSAGDYEFRLTYRTDLPLQAWIGGPLPEPQNSLRLTQVEPLWKQVPKGAFTSSLARIKLNANAVGN